MIRKACVAALGAGMLVAALAPVAGAAPSSSQGKYAEGPFEVVCNGTAYSLLDSPNAEQANFGASFVVGTNQVVVPYWFDATQTVTLVSDTATFDGVTYNAGDILFTGSQAVGHQNAHRGGQTCTFGGSGQDTFTDDTGAMVTVQFDFSGTALAMFPGTK